MGHRMNDDTFKKCLICQQSFDKQEDFFSHIRYGHKISQAEYFQSKYPRFDRQTGDIIKFKSRDFYFENEFNDKRNLKKWLSNQSEESQKDWCLNALKKRKESKGLIYAPCQLELRTTMIPSVNFLEKLFGDYLKLTKELGFKNKYEHLKSKLEITPIDKVSNRIIIDTREQAPLTFADFKTISQKLDEGDYGLEDEELSGKTRIERKSVGDLYGTLSTMGYDRFVRELVRAKAKKVKMLVLVEGTFEQVYAFPHLPQCRTVKASGDYIFHIMRGLIQEFPNTQFLFVNNREESVKVIETLLQTKGEWAKYDLQLAYDMGLLI
jgi:hypothetical protein